MLLQSFLKAIIVSPFIFHVLCPLKLLVSVRVKTLAPFLNPINLLPKAANRLLDGLEEELEISKCTINHFNGSSWADAEILW